MELLVVVVHLALQVVVLALDVVVIILGPLEDLQPIDIDGDRGPILQIPDRRRLLLQSAKAFFQSAARGLFRFDIQRLHRHYPTALLLGDDKPLPETLTVTAVLLPPIISIHIIRAYLRCALGSSCR